MTRMLPTVVGLTLLALAPVRTAAQVAGSLDEAARDRRFTHGGAVTLAALLTGGDAHCDSNAGGLHSNVRVSEPSSKESAITDACRTGDAARTDFSKRDWPRVAAPRNARAVPLTRVFREQAPPAADTRVLRPSLQGGLFGLGTNDTVWGGGFFGAGVTALPFPNLALLADGHLVGAFDGLAGFYGSGTAALRGVLPDSSRGEIAGVAGVGLGFFLAEGYVAAGPQFVFGLEGEAAFGQLRVLRFPDGDGAFVLLGGFRF